MGLDVSIASRRFCLIYGFGSPNARLCPRLHSRPAPLLILVILFVPGIPVGGRYYQDRARSIAAAVSGLPTMARAIATSIDANVQGTTELHFGLSRARDLDSHDKAARSEIPLRRPREKSDLTAS